MKEITLNTPGKIVFGPGKVNRAFDEFSERADKRIFMLTIRPVLENIGENIEKLRTKGIDILIDTSLESEPTFAGFERLSEKVREFDPQSIVGIGGGSVLDMAKLLAVFKDLREPVSNYTGIGLLPGRKTYLVCIPTTSGTGSEVSPNAILLDEQDGLKKGIISPYLVPDAAYIDPELTLSLPAGITAYTGVDALTHCIEAFTNRFSHPYIDVIALDGISLIAQNLQKACTEGHDLEVRSNLAMGSLYGGMCLGPVNTAAVHALAYPLGSFYRIPHGLSNALLLPHVMEYNLPASIDRHAQIALRLGVPDGMDQATTAMEGLEKIRILLRSVGIPSKLRHAGVKKETIEDMATAAMQVQRLLKNNPREVTWEDAREIYLKAY